MSVRTCLRALAALLVSTVVLLPGLPATAQPASAAPAPPVSAPADPSGTTSAGASTTTTASAATYVVRPGDTLTAIARTTGTAGGWPALYAANRDVLGGSPDLVRAGTELVLPVTASVQPSAQPASYAVERGDSLRAVAARLGVEGGWPALYAANRDAVGPDPDRLAVGTLLQVPAPAAAPTAAAPAAPAAPGAAAAPDAGVGTRLGAPPVTPAAPEGSSAAPVPAPSPVPDTDAGSPSTLPAWVLWPLALVAVLAVLALVGDPLLALVRRRAARRAQARRQGQEPAAEAGAALSLVSRVVELAALADEPSDEPGDDGPLVHVAEHPVLLVTYSPADDLVLVLLPPQHRVDDVLQVARVALTERAYRAVERSLPTPLRPPAGGPLAARWAG